MKTCYVDDATRSIADLCDAAEMGFVGRVITRINVPVQHRGLGHGSALLRRICRDADREGVVLYLEVLPSDSRGVMIFDALTAWYKRHGFRPHSIYPIMVRRPRHHSRKQVPPSILSVEDMTRQLLYRRPHRSRWLTRHGNSRTVRCIAYGRWIEAKRNR